MHASCRQSRCWQCWPSRTCSRRGPCRTKSRLSGASEGLVEVAAQNDGMARACASWMGVRALRRRTGARAP
eukprot:3035509-Prymnesium_polylepis.1